MCPKRLQSTLLLFTMSLIVLSNPQSVKFKNLTVKDGLSSNWVKCFLEDSRGFLWIGTNDGLNKYNGYQFESYKYHDTIASLNDNNINVIFEDSENNLWVGTHSGINLYDREKDTFTNVPDIWNYVSDIFELPNRELLIGSPGGLYLLNPQSLSALQINQHLNIDQILSDSLGNIYMAGKNGAYVFKSEEIPNSFFRMPDANHTFFPDCDIKSMYIDRHDQIWMGTVSNGLALLVPDYENDEFVQKRFQHQASNPASIKKGAVLAISEGPAGAIWLGIENNGLDSFTPTSSNTSQISFNHHQHSPVDEHSLSFNSVHALYHDRKGTIWVGLYSNGIDYYNKNLFRFNHYYSIPGNDNTLTSNSVNTFLDLGDEMLIGTEKGLNRLNKSTGDIDKFLPRTPETDPEIVWSLLRDQKGRIWIGTWDNGIIVYDPGTGEKRNFRHDPEKPNSLGNNHIFDIIEDRSGNIWVACLGGGLNKYNPEKQNFKRYQFSNRPNSISNNWVTTLMESNLGEIWISTTQAINILNPENGRFHTFRHKKGNLKSVSSSSAICFLQDSKNNIWLGTKNGLNLFVREDSTFISYGTGDGLPDNTINAICEDQTGNLWLSTKRGLSKFVDGTSSPKDPVFVNYSIHDGLQDLEFNRRSGIAASDGKLYFGGMNGFNVFHPDSLKRNENQSEIVFRDLLLFNKSVEIDVEGSPLKSHINESRELTLKHDQSVITIEYAALELLHPQKVKYAYKMEGFDKEWVDADQQRSATYTNLNPGKYKFLVAAATGTEPNYASPASISLEILPPWWLSVPAKIFYVILILLALYFFRRYTIISIHVKNELWLDHLQKEKEEELTRMKLQFFTNISHELRTPLTLILTPLDRLRRKWQKTRELEVIHTNVHKINTLVDQILNFRRIESGAMPVKKSSFDLIQRISSLSESFAYQAESKNISLTFQASHSQLIIQSDQEKLEIILNNLISNALKFTPANGTITVEANLHGNTLILSVSDTGRGIPESEINKIFNRFYTQGDTDISSGIGLHLVKRVVELLNGVISVASEKNDGTTFTINLPITESEIQKSTPEEFKLNLSTANKPRIDTIGKQSCAGNPSIMVVDDNPEICENLYETLKDQFNVSVETNPQKGLEEIKTNIPDLIISDVMMPFVSGFDLCEEIKTDLRTSHIPVILLTADISKESRLEGFETGADEYICKPFDEAILISRIRNLLKQRERIRNQLIQKDLTINPDSNIKKLDRDFLQQVLDIIRNNFSEPEFNANAVIEQSGMSRSVFYKKFKAVSNQSVNELIKQTRLIHAQKLLKQGHLTISEVAYVCGYNDPSYFCRVFKDAFHTTPGEFVSVR